MSDMQGSDPRVLSYSLLYHFHCSFSFSCRHLARSFGGGYPSSVDVFFFFVWGKSTPGTGLVRDTPLHQLTHISDGGWGVNPPRTWQQHRHDLWDRCGLSDRSSLRGGNPD